MRIFVTILFLVGAIAIDGCGSLSESAAAEEQNIGKATKSVIGVVAPSNEPSFEERFNIKLSLPMNENEFIGLIEELELDFYAEGPDSLNLKNKYSGSNRPTPPIHTLNYDMSDISHSYMIIGGLNEAEQRLESYLALVRNDREVVYIENYFSYGGE